MSHGWSESDKKVTKAALERARKRADDEALELFKKEPVQTIGDLWALELKIRTWKKQREGRFYFAYDTVERKLADCIKRGWLSISDLQSMSEKRLARIREMG